MVSLSNNPIRLYSLTLFNNTSFGTKKTINYLIAAWLFEVFKNTCLAMDDVFPSSYNFLTFSIALDEISLKFEALRFILLWLCSQSMSTKQILLVFIFIISCKGQFVFFTLAAGLVCRSSGDLCWDSIFWCYVDTCNNSGYDILL